MVAIFVHFTYLETGAFKSNFCAKQVKNVSGSYKRHLGKIFEFGSSLAFEQV